MGDGWRLESGDRSEDYIPVVDGGASNVRFGAITVREEIEADADDDELTKQLLKFAGDCARKMQMSQE
jgi:uncharacterized protein YuzB (UPF0349 family)